MISEFVRAPGANDYLEPTVATSPRTSRSSFLHTALFLLGALVVGSSVLFAPAPIRADDAVGLLPLIIHAKTHSPDMISAADNLKLAEQRIGSAISKHLLRVSASNRMTYRYSNPDKYTYSFSYDGTECTNPMD